MGGLLGRVMGWKFVLNWKVGTGETDLDMVESDSADASTSPVLVPVPAVPELGAGLPTWRGDALLDDDRDELF